jgi:hypothetical protein
MCLVYARALSIHNSAQGFPTAQLKIIDLWPGPTIYKKKLKFSQKKYVFSTLKLKKVKKTRMEATQLEKELEETKIMRIKIKIKFDDIISIKEILFQTAPQLLENIPEYNKENKIKSKLILFYSLLDKKYLPKNTELYCN